MRYALAMAAASMLMSPVRSMMVPQDPSLDMIPYHGSSLPDPFSHQTLQDWEIGSPHGEASITQGLFLATTANRTSFDREAMDRYAFRKKNPSWYRSLVPPFRWRINKATGEPLSPYPNPKTEPTILDLSLIHI